MKDEIVMVPIEQIRVLNARQRDPMRLTAVVASIKALGLIEPVLVSRQSADVPEGPGYDLVCGQGRIEACRSLGWKEIPVVVLEEERGAQHDGGGNL